MTTRTFLALGIFTALSFGCTPGSGPAGRATGLENGSFTADLDGVEIHYEVHGSGPVVMTVPNSWGLSLGGLRGLYRPLEERYTFVYFDPRGMGASGPVRETSDMGLAAVREDFDALRRHLGLERVNAIGWSNGATNLIQLALERPQTLSSAIFLHTGASFTAEDAQVLAERAGDAFGRWMEFERRIEQAGLPAEEENRELESFILGFFPLMCADPEACAGQLAEVYSGVEFSFAHMRYSSEDAPSFDFREQLAGIPVRSLVIAGEHDMMPPEKCAELADGLQDARLVVFDESGHFAPIEEPEKFAATLTEFLGS
jgi:proline iminopeptidase